MLFCIKHHLGYGLAIAPKRSLLAVILIYVCVNSQSGRKYGVLTALGKEQGYVLGQKLRRRYMNKLHLLSPEFDPQLI